MPLAVLNADNLMEVRRMLGSDTRADIPLLHPLWISPGTLHMRAKALNDHLQHNHIRENRERYDMLKQARRQYSPDRSLRCEYADHDIALLLRVQAANNDVFGELATYIHQAAAIAVIAECTQCFMASEDGPIFNRLPSSIIKDPKEVVTGYGDAPYHWTIAVVKAETEDPQHNAKCMRESTLFLRHHCVAVLQALCNQYSHIYADEADLLVHASHAIYDIQARVERYIDGLANQTQHRPVPALPNANVLAFPSPQA